MIRHRPAIILDIDNTLFDWLRMWHAAFSAMLDCLVAKSGIPREQLTREFKVVHQRRGTVEYSFAIEELPSLREAYPDEDLNALFSDAIDAYRTERRKHLVLYEGVAETLKALRNANYAIAAYTESQAFLARRRVQWLGLDGLIDILYSTPDHEIPSWIDIESVRRYPEQYYQLRWTQHVVIEAGTHKPQPDVLDRIVADLRVSKERAAYVGDSLHHDVLMAQQASIGDVWAEYGVIPNRHEYDLLVAVTHWTEARVALERSLRSIEVQPTYRLRHGFSELLSIAPGLVGQHVVGHQRRLG